MTSPRSAGDDHVQLTDLLDLDQAPVSTPRPRRRGRRVTVLGAAIAVCLAAVGGPALWSTRTPEARGTDVATVTPSPAALQAPASTARVPVPTSAPRTSTFPAAAPSTKVPAPATTSARPTTTTAAAPTSSASRPTAAVPVSSTAAAKPAAAAVPTGTATLPTPPAVATRPSAAATRPAVPVEQFGAVGDGVHDDTAALQKALDSVPVSSVLKLRAGATYLHSRVLEVDRAGTAISGVGATVTATDQLQSAFHVDADRVEVSGVTFALATSTERFHAYEQMKVRVSGNDVVLRDVHVRGAAAAGIYVGNGSARFLLDRVTVTDSRADGIHVTGGAKDGRIVSPVTTRTGDDGIAVVSYKKDGVPCARVQIVSPTVNGTTWGRGISVVGGEDVSYTDVRIRDTDAAAVYIGSEGDPYWTFPSRRVLVSGGTVTGANDNAAKDHGSVLVYSGNAGTDTRDVTVQGLTVTGTRRSATWDVGVLADRGAAVNRVALLRLTLVGGPALPLYTSTPSAVRVSGLSDDGAAVAARSGW